MGAVDSDGASGAPEFSVVAGLEPFAWSQDDAVAYEVALDTIGMVIACYSDLIAAERSRPRPDLGAVEAWRSARTTAAAAQSGLAPDDRAAIDATIREYGAAYRSLTAEVSASAHG
jgi:hypothetical protein